MSVINQMLKDLESRKEQGSDLPQPDFSKKESGAGRWLIRLLVVLLIAGAAYWLWLENQSEPAPAPKPVAALVEQSVEPESKTQTVKTEAAQVTAPKEPSQKPLPPKAESKASVVATAKNQQAASGWVAEKPEPAQPPTPQAPSTASEPAPIEEMAPVASIQPAVEPAPVKQAPQPASQSPAPKAKIQLHRMSPAEVAVAQLKQARQARAAGQFQQAESSYQTSLRMKPAQHEARAELAQLYLQQQRLNDAWQQAEVGIRFHPETTEFYRVKAQVLHQQGKLEGAWQTLEQVSDSDFLSDDFLMLKAGLANQLGRHEMAYILYVRLSERAPNSGRWWFGRALSAEFLVRPDEAKYCYQRALKSQDLSSASRNYATHRMKRLGAL